MNFSAVILAGGKSSRMGSDKAWLDVGGRPLLARQIELAREAGAREVFISGRAEADYATFGCPVWRDKFPEAGPLAGIERALAAATSPLLLVLAVDLPAMRAEFLRRLAAGCGRKFKIKNAKLKIRRPVLAVGSGVIPCVNGQMEPLAAYYPKAAHALAVTQLERGRLAVKEFAERCAESGFVRVVELAVADTGHFANWNSPADVTRATG